MPDENLIPNDQAKLNITWQGGNGDLVDPIPFNASDEDIRTWAAEAVRTGGVPGIQADQRVDFSNFVVDRFEPTEVRTYRILMLRSKTPFGV
jgi:hypothetical protein